MAEAAPAAEGGPGEAAAKPQAAGGLTPLMLERSVKQIEFYFSDSNLPRDKFLLDKVHASPAGWVDLGLVATFERMRELLKVSAPRIPPATIAALAQALRTNAPSLVVSDDGKSVRRTQPLAVGEEETINKAVEARSLYAAPFPYDATLDKLMAFFGEHGTVNSIRLRRHVNSLDFNGTAFVEMGSVSQAEELMKKEGVVHEGATLRFELRKDFVARKTAERAEQPERPARPAANARKAPAAAGAKQPEEAAAAVPAAPVDPARAAQEALETMQIAVGTVVVFRLGEGADEVLHQDMKEAFTAFGVKYIDLPRGATTGYARFESAEVAAEAAAAALEGLEAGGKPLAACYVMSDADVGAYAVEAVAKVKAQREELAKKKAEQKKADRQAGAFSRGSSWQGGRGGRGGRGGGGYGGRGAKRPRTDGDAKPPAKKSAPAEA